MTALGGACSKACAHEEACHGFTFAPGTGDCYLKSKMSTIKGANCEENCWFSGAVRHKPLRHLDISDARKELGLKLVNVKDGHGKHLKRGDTATIGYVGKLDDGTTFDSGKYVFTFGEGQVIAGTSPIAC